MQHTRVAIVGAGPAGTVLAYWLAKGGARVTVLERSPNNLRYGQGIDVEGPAREVVEKMGLVDEMRARSTGEQGFSIVDDHGNAIATLGTQGLSLTQEIEIMRGDLCDIFCKAADQLENVTFQYGRTITTISQSDKLVNVTFDDGKTTDFEAVIGADGKRSKTRELAFDKSAKENAVKPVGGYCAYFTIPHEKGDFPNSRIQHAQGSRSCLVRPVDEERSSAYLMLAAKSDELASATRDGRDEQKQALKDAFSGTTGLLSRVVEQMMQSDNFYLEQLAQIKLSTWSQERVALVGDAAYCPTPITGSGTLLAILGAYVLAGEMSETPGNLPTAFQAYEKRLRKYVEDTQKIPLGGRAPNIVNPETAWGVFGIRSAFRLISWAFKIISWLGLSKVFNIRRNPFELPVYPKLEGKLN